MLPPTATPVTGSAIGKCCCPTGGCHIEFWDSLGLCKRAERGVLDRGLTKCRILPQQCYPGSFSIKRPLAWFGLHL